MKIKILTIVAVQIIIAFIKIDTKAQSKVYFYSVGDHKNYQVEKNTIFYYVLKSKRICYVPEMRDNILMPVFLGDNKDSVFSIVMKNNNIYYYLGDLKGFEIERLPNSIDIVFEKSSKMSLGFQGRITFLLLEKNEIIQYIPSLKDYYKMGECLVKCKSSQDY